MKHSNNIYTDLFKTYQGVDVKDDTLKFRLLTYASFDSEICVCIRIEPVKGKKHRKFVITITPYKDCRVKTFQANFFQLKNYLNSLLMNGIFSTVYHPSSNFEFSKVIMPILNSSSIDTNDKIKVRLGLYILAAFDTYYHQGITLNILKSLIPTLKKYLIIKYKNTTVTPPWYFLINYLETNIVSPRNKDSFPFDFVYTPHGLN